MERWYCCFTRSAVIILLGVSCSLSQGGSGDNSLNDEYYSSSWSPLSTTSLITSSIIGRTLSSSPSPIITPNNGDVIVSGNTNPGSNTGIITGIIIGALLIVLLLLLCCAILVMCFIAKRKKRNRIIDHSFN